MNCVICKNGTTAEGFVTVTLQRNSSIIIIKTYLQKFVIIVVNII